MSKTDDIKIALELVILIREHAKALGKVAHAAIRKAFHPDLSHPSDDVPGPTRLMTPLTNTRNLDQIYNRLHIQRKLSMTPASIGSLAQIHGNHCHEGNGSHEDYSFPSQIVFFRIQKRCCGMKHNKEHLTSERTTHELPISGNYIVTFINDEDSNNVPRVIMSN